MGDYEALRDFLGMSLMELPKVTHQDTSKRHWDQPLSCVKCGGVAEVYYVIQTDLVGPRWLDLCPACDSALRLLNPAEPSIG